MDDLEYAGVTIVCFRGFTRTTLAKWTIAYARPPPRTISSAVPESPVQGDSSRAIVTRSARPTPNGHHIKPHWHARAQFIFAVAGTMRVRTPRRAWIVPPSRALWVPAHTVHEIQMYGVVEMRSLYVNDARGAGMPSSCVVLNVTPLLRELVVRAVALPVRYDEEGDDGLLMRLLDGGDPAPAAVRARPAAAGEPGPDASFASAYSPTCPTRRPCGIDASDMNTSTRTLYRRFLRETGITFARWKQQARLLESIRRLAEGAPVTTVAMDLGYESPSAFSTMFRRSLGIAPRAFLNSPIARGAQSGRHGWAQLP